MVTYKPKTGVNATLIKSDGKNPIVRSFPIKAIPNDRHKYIIPTKITRQK